MLEIIEHLLYTTYVKEMFSILVKIASFLANSYDLGFEIPLLKGTCTQSKGIMIFKSMTHQPKSLALIVNKDSQMSSVQTDTCNQPGEIKGVSLWILG